MIGAPETRIDEDDGSPKSSIVRQKRNRIAEAVVNKYRSYIFSVDEPIEDLENSAEALSKKGQGHGRKPKSSSKNRSKFEFTGSQLHDDVSPEKVYLHTVYNTDISLTSYGMTAKFKKASGQIRILKLSESQGWRNVLPYEFPVYNYLIQEETRRRFSKFEKYDVYGTMLNDKKFRIRDKTTEKHFPEGHKDMRIVNEGEVCNTWHKPQLIFLMLEEYKKCIQLAEQEEAASLEDKTKKPASVGRQTNIGKATSPEVNQNTKEALGTTKKAPIKRTPPKPVEIKESSKKTSKYRDYAKILYPDNIRERDFPLREESYINQLIDSRKFTRKESDYTDDDLAFVNRWYMSNKSKDDICQALLIYFSSTGRLLLI